MFKPTSLLAAVVGLAGLLLHHPPRRVDAFAPARRVGIGVGGVAGPPPTPPSLLPSRTTASIFDGAAAAAAAAAATTTTAPSSSAATSMWSSSRRATAAHRRRRISSGGLQMSRSRLTFSDEVVVESKTSDETTASSSFDPLNLCGGGGGGGGRGGGWDSAAPASRTAAPSTRAAAPVLPAAATTALPSPTFVVAGLLLLPAPPALAASSSGSSALSQGDFNPDTFRPVCAASDSFYRLLQSSTRAIVGDDNFSEYGPLIAGGLLRIRLELCVVESFFNEAVGPFVRQNGLNWVLPLHETVETFLAGSIFALATTFILVGSTKLIQVIAFYADLVLGGPCRLFGGFFFDRARGMPVTLDVSFFGLWRTRLVGPPLDQDESKNGGGTPGDRGETSSSLFALVDFDKVRPADVPLLALFGAIKVVGETSKVSCASSRLCHICVFGREARDN